MDIDTTGRVDQSGRPSKQRSNAGRTTRGNTNVVDDLVVDGPVPSQLPASPAGSSRVSQPVAFESGPTGPQQGQPSKTTSIKTDVSATPRATTAPATSANREDVQLFRLDRLNLSSEDGARVAAAVRTRSTRRQQKRTFSLADADPRQLNLRSRPSRTADEVDDFVIATTSSPSSPHVPASAVSKNDAVPASPLIQQDLLKASTSAPSKFIPRAAKPHTPKPKQKLWPRSLAPLHVLRKRVVDRELVAWHRLKRLVVTWRTATFRHVVELMTHYRATTGRAWTNVGVLTELHLVFHSQFPGLEAVPANIRHDLALSNVCGILMEARSHLDEHGWLGDDPASNLTDTTAELDHQARCRECFVLFSFFAHIVW